MFEHPQLQWETYFLSGFCALGATLTDVWCKKKKSCFCLKFIKSKGVLCEKWIMENRRKSCSSWVCLRRRQNGVHETSVSAVPNEQKVLIWKKPWKNRLDAIVKNNSFSNRRSSKYVVFPERQSYFTYGDLHSSGLENHAFQLTLL